MDVSDKDLDQDPSLAICLLLPLEFVIQVTAESSFIPKKKLSSMRVSDAYLFDATINHIRSCRYDELSVGRGVIIHLFRALESGEILLAAFLARAPLPGVSVLEVDGFYLGRVNLQPLYARFNIDNTPLHTIPSHAYKSFCQLSAITTTNDDPDYLLVTKST